MATTIANLSRIAVAGKDPGAPTFIDIIKLDLKADYEVGGLASFSTEIEGTIGKNKTILGVMPIHCKGLQPEYLAATDALNFRWCDNNAVADGPYINVPTTNMAAYTNLTLAVISQ